MPVRCPRSSFSNGTNVTVIPEAIDKKTKVQIKLMTLKQNGADWEPTSGMIKYQFCGQKGTAELLAFLATP